jgi:hypothetical protein
MHGLLESILNRGLFRQASLKIFGFPVKFPVRFLVEEAMGLAIDKKDGGAGASGMRRSLRGNIAFPESEVK